MVDSDTHEYYSGSAGNDSLLLADNSPSNRLGKFDHQVNGPNVAGYKKKNMSARILPGVQKGPKIKLRKSEREFPPTEDKTEFRERVDQIVSKALPNPTLEQTRTRIRILKQVLRSPYILSKTNYKSGLGSISWNPLKKKKNDRTGNNLTKQKILKIRKEKIGTKHKEKDKFNQDLYRFLAKAEKEKQQRNNAVTQSTSRNSNNGRANLAQTRFEVLNYSPFYNKNENINKELPEKLQTLTGIYKDDLLLDSSDEESPAESTKNRKSPYIKLRDNNYQSNINPHKLKRDVDRELAVSVDLDHIQKDKFGDVMPPKPYFQLSPKSTGSSFARKKISRKNKPLSQDLDAKLSQFSKGLSMDLQNHYELEGNGDGVHPTYIPSMIFSEDKQFFPILNKMPGVANTKKSRSTRIVPVIKTEQLIINKRYQKEPISTKNQIKFKPIKRPDTTVLEGASRSELQDLKFFQPLNKEGYKINNTNANFSGAKKSYSNSFSRGIQHNTIYTEKKVKEKSIEKEKDKKQKIQRQHFDELMKFSMSYKLQSLTTQISQLKDHSFLIKEEKKKKRVMFDLPDS